MWHYTFTISHTMNMRCYGNLWYVSMYMGVFPAACIKRFAASINYSIRQRRYHIASAPFHTIHSIHGIVLPLLPHKSTALCTQLPTTTTTTIQHSNTPTLLTPTISWKFAQRSVKRVARAPRTHTTIKG